MRASRGVRPKSERIRRAIIHDAEPDQGHAGVTAPTGHNLPDGVVGQVAPAVVVDHCRRHETLDDARVDQVLHEDGRHGEGDREPRRSPHKREHHKSHAHQEGR